jgi:hypothetical protein
MDLLAQQNQSVRGNANFPEEFFQPRIQQSSDGGIGKGTGRKSKGKKNKSAVLPFSSAHVDAFLRLDCGILLLQHGLFPRNSRTQEISESMACLSAVDEHLCHARAPELTSPPLLFSDEDVMCVVVGDGCTPRTAALFAHRTKWRRIVSIDPALASATAAQRQAWGGCVTRMEVVAEKVEDAVVHVDPATTRRVVIVLPHAHCVPDVVLQCLRFPAAHAPAGPSADGPPAPDPPAVSISIVQLPCCWLVWHETICGLYPADTAYMDSAVFASARSVRIWHDVAPAAASPGARTQAVWFGERAPNTAQLLTGAQAGVARARKRAERAAHAASVAASASASALAPTPASFVLASASATASALAPAPAFSPGVPPPAPALAPALTPAPVLAPAQAGQTSDCHGVSWNKAGQRWKAEIDRNGQRRHLGYFALEADAAEACEQANTR